MDSEPKIVSRSATLPVRVMEREIRILVTVNIINRGGASRVTMDLLRSLRERGLEVALAVATSGDDEVCGHESFEVFRFSLPRASYRLPCFRDVFVRTARSAWYKRVLRKFRPDVVLSVSVTETVIELNSGLSVPCICHVHAIHQEGLTKSLSNLRKLASFADHYLVSSKAMEDRLRYNLGVASEKITVLYNGVPVRGVRERAAADPHTLRTELGLGEDEIIVVGCGAVNFVKGTDLFLRVAESAKRHCNNKVPLSFIWIGEQHVGKSPLWDGCQRLAEDLGLGDLVRFMGHREDIIPLLENSDLFVVTSRAESLPLAMMEAMALGKPVVAFPVGGIREALSLGGGVVTSSHEPEEMGRIVAELAANRERRCEMGAQAQHTIQDHFDSEQLFGRFESFLMDFARGHEHCNTAPNVRGG